LAERQGFFATLKIIAKLFGVVMPL